MPGITYRAAFRSPVAVRFARTAAAAALLSIMPGCSGFLTPFAADAEAIDEGTHQSAARIRLSPPQVFTREQLINDRLREDSFLRNQLDNSQAAVLGTNLSRDLQTVSALSAQLSLSVDPALGIDFRRANQQAQLQQQVDLVELRAQLLNLRRQLVAMRAGGNAVAPIASAPSTSVSSDASTTVPDARIATLQTTLDGALTAIASLGDTTRANGTAPTFLDDYEDRVATRRVIREDINANALDDSHDLEGNALYHLQFTATVLPGEHKSQYGIARVTVQPPTFTAAEINKLYYTWLADVTVRMNQGFNAKEHANGPMSFQTLGPLSGLYEVAVWKAPNPLDKYSNDELARRYPSPQDQAIAKKALEQKTRFEVRLAVPIGIATAFEPMQDVRPVIHEAATSLRDWKLTHSTATATEWVAERDEAIRVACENYPACGRASKRKSIAGTSFIQGSMRHVILMAPSVEMASFALGDRSGGVPANVKRLAAADLREYEQAFADAKLLLGCRDGDDGTECPKEVNDDRLPVKLAELDLPHLIGGGDLQPRYQSSIAKFATQVLRGMDTGCPVDGSPSTCVYAFPYSTDPSMRVQRVSTVASAANALDLAFAANVNVPNAGAAIGGGASYARRAAGRVDAIERVPEIIGFAGRSNNDDNGPYEFGWLFGPKLSLDASGNRMLLRQQARTVPVSADLSLPAWWPSAKLKVKVAWKGNFDGSGTVLSSAPAPDEEDTYTLPVHFRLNPASLNALTVELSRATTAQGYHQARIDRVEPQVLPLCADASTSGKNVTLLIYGVDLWRNPQVVVGGQALPSGNISVLPDMSGISAMVDTSTISRAAIDADPVLVVWTGHGAAETQLRTRVGAACEAAAGDPTARNAQSEKAEILRVSPSQISTCDAKAVISVAGQHLPESATMYYLGSVQASRLDRGLMAAVPASAASGADAAKTTAKIGETKRSSGKGGAKRGSARQGATVAAASTNAPDSDADDEDSSEVSDESPHAFTLTFDKLQDANKNLTSLALTMVTPEGVLSVPIDASGQPCKADGSGGSPAFSFSANTKDLAPDSKTRKAAVVVLVSLPVGAKPFVTISAKEGRILSQDWDGKPPKGFTLTRTNAGVVVSSSHQQLKPSDPLAVSLSLGDLVPGTTLTLTAEAKTDSTKTADKIAPQTAAISLQKAPSDVSKPTVPDPDAPKPAFTLSTTLKAVPETTSEHPYQTMHLSIGFPQAKAPSVSVAVSSGGELAQPLSVAFTDSQAPTNVTVTQTGESIKFATTDTITAASKPFNVDLSLRTLVAGQTLVLAGTTTVSAHGAPMPQVSLPVISPPRLTLDLGEPRTATP